VNFVYTLLRTGKAWNKRPMQFPNRFPAAGRESIGLVIVDDHVFMRDLMARTMARHRTRYTVLAAVGSAGDAKSACRKFQPDLLILDINLPDQSGIDALPELKRIAPAMRVLLCTGFPTDDRIADLATYGAHGFVEKTNSWDDFLQAVDHVSRGEYYFCSRSVASRVLPDYAQRNAIKGESTPYLTCREKEVITFIAEGLTSKEIGSKLHISVATVETHRTNLMKKLQVRNVAALVKCAFHGGLVKPHVARPFPSPSNGGRN
jgi:DNA-binding NarL/FixJ family response regulator